MKVAFAAPPLSGKTALFEAVTGNRAPGRAGTGATAVVRVPDERVDWLVQVYQPKSIVHATVEFHDLPGLTLDSRDATDRNARTVAALRDAEALLCVTPLFDLGKGLPDLEQADRTLESLRTELTLADLAIVEKRNEKLKLQIQRKQGDVELAKAESRLLDRFHQALEEETAADIQLNASEEKMVRAYQFLSTKPALVIYNLDEERFTDAAQRKQIEQSRPGAIAICAALEADIAELPPPEQVEFLADLDLDEPTGARMVKACYRLLDLASFLTVGTDEVRAWTIRNGDTALQAAGKIHSDIARGFIRAEIIPYEAIKEHGDFKKAKAAGAMRLEGKEYLVRDGDVINFRFSV